MMYKRYEGDICSINGTLWTIRIMQEADMAFPEVGELTFPSQTPLEIEWSNRAKEVPICGSTATLTVISPGDRTYEDLYTVDPGHTRLDVLKEGLHYWSGCLDPEFYEEPYAYLDGYNVTFTFSDFGILGRMKYNLTGMQALSDILSDALHRAKLDHLSVKENLISTYLEESIKLSMQSLQVRSDNWFDEDGEASTMEEVLNGILQPLALKMVQKCGALHIYDINGLYQFGEGKNIVWGDKNQMLGVDRVYNNAKITFSPYASGQLQRGEIKYEDIVGTEWTNLTSDADGVKYNGQAVPEGKPKPDCYSFYLDYDPKHRHGYDWDYALVGFTIFKSREIDKCKGLAAIGSGNYFFRIMPMLGGTESTGVIGGFYTGGHGSLDTGWPKLKGVSPSRHQESIAMRTNRVYIPYMDNASAQQNFMKIKMELLFDARYNPFESAGEGNDQSAYEEVENYANLAFVPISLTVRDGTGKALCHYSNRKITTYAHPGDSVMLTSGEWLEGEASFGEAWLEYYDPESLYKCAVQGWKSNRQNIGSPKYDFFFSKQLYYTKYPETNRAETAEWWWFSSFRKIPEGQYIKYPPHGGYLEMIVYNGVWVFSAGNAFTQDLSSSNFRKKGLYNSIRWQLYKCPEISIVKNSLIFDEAQVDDIEYAGKLNDLAKEQISIDTICGTSVNAIPTARGMYFRAKGGNQVNVLSRAGRRTQAEQLLIGTLYSQYAERKITLSGTALGCGNSLAWYKDTAQGDRKFMLLSEVEDIYSDEKNIMAVEFVKDNYSSDKD